MQTFAGILLAVLGAAASTPVDVHVSLSPPEIPFHRQAAYSIVVEAPADVEVQVPDMGDKFGGAKAQGEPQRVEESLPEGRRRVRVTYTLEAVKPGDYRIEPVEVTWPGGRATVASPALRVRDLTPDEVADLERFAPIVMPAPRESLIPSWAAWAVSAVALAGAAVALAAWLLARRRRLEELPGVPRMPWEVARERLRALAALGLAEAGDARAFYIELSDILRRYIEDRFHVHAPERTTPEFLGEAAGTGLFSQDQQEMLAAVLRHADRVKFAKHEPAAGEMHEDFEGVRRFVDDTVPRLATVQAEEAA